MNTPSHAILNLTLLGKTVYPDANLIIVFGGILPDIPIFIFYGWAKFIAKMPDSKIWSEAYYDPIVQDIVALFHSIPLAVIGLVIAIFFEWKMIQVLCLSLILHSLLDLPVHNDDAHRHFFPFSNYRFISPISYWDPQHYGNIVAFVEIVLVFIGTILSFSIVNSPIGKGLMILVNGFYIFGYFYFYLKSSLGF
jgi:hypothetical protein